MFRWIQIAAVGGFLASQALASNISFTGTFTQDDQVQLFDVLIPVDSTITIQTLGYAGGTNAALASIPAGGFDPAVWVFDSAGFLLASVSSGGCSLVGTDSVSGACFDAYYHQLVQAGQYTIALTLTGNVPLLPTLADGFSQTGNPTFTCAQGFCDELGNPRNGNWALDVLNVGSATEVGGTVPEPGTFFLAGLGAGLAAWARKLSSR